MLGQNSSINPGRDISSLTQMMVSGKQNELASRIAVDLGIHTIGVVDTVYLDDRYKYSERIR